MGSAPLDECCERALLVAGDYSFWQHGDYDLTKALSKTKVDLLGDRLRQGSFTESDLKLLDEYRFVLSMTLSSR